MKRALSVFMFVLLLVSTLTMAFKIQPVRAEPRTWTVDDDGPADFTSIQDAVNAASTGDTVYVKNGTYYENVDVNKSISLTGESKENTIVDGGGTAAVIYIEEDNVLVTGFTVRNSGWGYYYYESSGITIDRASFCNISDNIATNIRYGISSWLGQNNSISRNTIPNADQGISFNGPYYNKIISNSISNTVVGIGLWVNSYYSIVVNNTISNSSDAGIHLDNTPYALITDNILTDNYYGIYLYQSHINTIYHNSFINNTQQVFLSNSGATWDDGYPSGGNYWSDYAGVDANEDGIGDTSYTVDSGNIDYYPLMEPWTQPWENWSHYHNYTEIARTLIYLNETYPSIVNVFSIGKSWLNQDIYCIRLTNEDITHPKPKLLFVGYHHARELISAELALYFAVEATTSFGTNETLTRMLNYSEIYIIPALNVDGFNVVKQNEWQRKNVHPFDEDSDTLFDEDPPEDANGDGYLAALVSGTPPWDPTSTIIGWEGTDNDNDGLSGEDWIGGVDINRNYGYQWNATCFSGSPDPSAEDYRGPAPFSEPETQAIRDLALSNDFKYAISFHSGSESIGYPWGYTADPTPDDSIFRQIASNLSALVGDPWYGQSASGMYTMSGSWDDWMYANRSTLAFTCEIYTNNSAWQFEPGPEPDTWWMKGVFQFFNPDTSQIETVVQRWLPTFTYVTDRAITEAYDITTTNVTPLKTIVGQGFSTQIDVNVTNKGDFTETFSVTIYANQTIIGEKYNVELTSGNSTIISFIWNTTGFAYGNYSVSAYAWPVQGETNTGDNTLSGGTVIVSHVGDVTGDGKCDIEDLARVSAAFGSLRVNDPNDPRYGQYWHPITCSTCPHTPNADIDNDGKVDILDLAMTSGNFGWHE
jgi:parallel beta-helix repeat protein